VANVLGDKVIVLPELQR